MKKSRFLLMKKAGAILFSVISIVPFFVTGSVLIAPSPVHAQAAGLPTCTRGYHQDIAQDGALLGTYTQADNVTPCSIANTDPALIAANNARSLSGAGPVSCGGFVKSITSPIVCGFRWFVAIISAAIISVDTWILAVISAFFNLLVTDTITQFSALYQSIQAPILVVWDAFRDMSNILIIGLFVFIAICTILGIKEYGYKKLVARVLIIAVLINFSLLFTKIIIDASNYTATVFYNASIPQSTTGTTNANGFTTSGIGGRFIGLLGVNTFGDTISKVEASGDNNDSIIAEILSASGAAIMLLGAAAVLLYGCFILFVRAVLLIILLLSSALAFATFLSPKLSAYGWDKWWNSLFRVAILAPILMLLLWATLNIATQLPPSGGTFGKLATTENATTPSEILELFNYVIILGLLFASFKISSSFASNLGITKIVSAATGYATGGLSSIGAFAGRNTISRVAMNRADTRTQEAKEARDKMDEAKARVKIHSDPSHPEYDTKKAEAARRDVERHKNTAAKATASAGRYAGIADIKFGGKPGLNTRIEDRSKAAAKLAEKLAPNEKDNERVRDAASGEAEKARKVERKPLEDERDTSKSALDAIRADKANLETAHKAAETDESGVKKVVDEKKADISREHDPIIDALSRQIGDKTAAGVVNSHQIDEIAKSINGKAAAGGTDNATEIGRLTEELSKKAAVPGGGDATEIARLNKEINDKAAAGMNDNTAQIGALTEELATKAATPGADPAEIARLNKEIINKATAGGVSAEDITKLTQGLTNAAQRGNADDIASIKKEISGKATTGATSNAAEIAQLTKQIVQKATEGARNTNEVDSLKVERERRSTQKKDELNSQDQKIETAHKNVKEIQEKINSATKGVAQAEAQFNAAKDKLTEFDKETKVHIAEAGKDAVKEYNHTVGEIAAEVGKRQGSAWTRFTGGATGENKRVGDATKKKYLHSHSQKGRVSALLKDMTKDEHEGGAEKKPGGGGDSH